MLSFQVRVWCPYLLLSLGVLVVDFRHSWCACCGLSWTGVTGGWQFGGTGVCGHGKDAYLSFVRVMDRFVTAGSRNASSCLDQ